jgi:hypothetical protein
MVFFVPLQLSIFYRMQSKFIVLVVMLLSHFCNCHVYTVKPTHAVTSSKQSPVLNGHIFIVLSYMRFERPKIKFVYISRVLLTNSYPMRAQTIVPHHGPNELYQHLLQQIRMVRRITFHSCQILWQPAT